MVSVDAAFLDALPTADPVRQIDSTVAAEIDVGGQDVPERLLFVFDFPARSIGGELKRTDAADCRGASEITQEKAVFEVVAESCAGIIFQTSRSVGDVGDWRHDVGGGGFVVRMPDFFAVEGASVADVLIVHSPASIAAVNDFGETCFVAAVGVVFAGEQIAVVIEGEFLRVSQPGHHGF